MSIPTPGPTDGDPDGAGSGRPAVDAVLARELHDGPLQSATALDLRLQLLVIRHPHDADAAAALSAAEGLVSDLRALEGRLRQSGR
jgi:hypothetical protein